MFTFSLGDIEETSKVPRKKRTVPPAKRYRVRKGLNYGDVRREPGDIVDDIPPVDEQWLLDIRAIEEVDEEWRDDMEQ